MAAPPAVDTRLAPPRLSEDRIAALLRDRYGVTGTLRPLPSERDQNIHVQTSSGAAYVLKISAVAEDERVLECQAAVLARLAEAETGFAFPTVVPAAGDGALIGSTTGVDGARHLVRLLRYVPGVPLASVRPHTPAVLAQLGAMLGAVSRALDGFTHPAAHRDLRWDLRVGRQVIAQCEETVTDAARLARIHRILDAADRAGVAFDTLRTSVVHNDANDFNVLVSPPDPDDPTVPRRIVGLVDFGDLVHSYTVGEVAIAAAYGMLGKRDPLAAAASIVGGYHAVYPLHEAEVAAIVPLIGLRLCTSAVLSAHQRAQEPGNDYLSVSEAPVWALLAQLEELDLGFAHCRLRAACGMAAHPRTAAVVAWLAGQARIGSVLPEGLGADARRRTTLDLSVGSTDAAVPVGRDTTEAWADAIAARLRSAGAEVGIGRYDEARRWYTDDRYRIPTDAGDEWRTVHLGVDLFVPPGTAVRAPLDGVVASVQDNDAPLDYGPTVLLRHELPDGSSVHTLYGHLARDVLTRWRAGDPVERSANIGTVGATGENGGWAPHLHLQVIVDPLGHVGDFPGVARPSERAAWLGLSPDPNLILRFPEGCRAPTPPTSAALLPARRRQIGPSLSIAYRAPLTIVRGWMQHLYDPDGRAYLDVVNNVAHVGHSHPDVVAALHRQSAVLNTNTRYLHPAILEYAARLTARLPAPLRVCYFVCSGSEANELALRLARAHTRRRDMIVVDHAYHGNTTALIELSPYKFDGPGGSGASAFVHKVLLPDPYRGPYRGMTVETGRRYAADVQRAIDDIERAGRRPAAFFAESIVSGGGQIEPPPGYLADAYARVRAAGGVCVADEVQIGFGRLGTHFWGFETQGVVPDIVTMGKPIGNGHPLGAVVTTPEIAASFDTGMEYFNTFGGNPVSCAVGLAVLEVIDREGLQAHARAVGDHLRAGLRGLMARHPLVGDVRGRGLFLGLELVRDRETLAPAPRHATYVVERMKECGILLSTEGPHHTVVKMKPPLAVTRADAERLVEHLDAILAELA